MIFVSTSEYFYYCIGTDEYYTMCYKVNDAETFKNLKWPLITVKIYFMLAHKSWYVCLTSYGDHLSVSCDYVSTK